MPYKITSVTTKPNLSVPNFDVWLTTVPQSVLDPYPDAAGKTPEQVINESITTLDNPAIGFISEGAVPDEDDLVWTWETVWVDKSAWSNALVKNTYIDGNANVGLTAGGFLRQLYMTENNITVENFESNI